MRSLTLLSILLLSLPAFAQEKTEHGVLITDLTQSPNWFNDMEKAKANPDKVLYLDLTLQKLKTFPKEILTFKNLERLYISYNYWPSIPEEIGTLTNLKIINMSGNYYLNHLPKEGFAKLVNLQELEVKDHKLVAGEIDKVKKLLPNCKVISE